MMAGSHRVENETTRRTGTWHGMCLAHLARRAVSRHVIVAAGLCIVTLLVYLPASRFDYLNYDDPDYVTENPHVLKGITAESVRWAFTAAHAFNWHPVTWLSHMLDVELFGSGPAWPHLANALLHTANALLVLVLLRQLTGQFWVSVFVAAFFALHPLRVESVAWVAERKDVLSTFFGLLTLLCYTLFAKGRSSGTQPAVQSSADSAQTQRAHFWYVLALLSFALGLMSKPMLVTWPFLMLLLDYWPLKRLSTNGAGTAHTLRNLVVEKLPFFALTVGSCLVTYYVQKQGAAVQTWFPVWARLENAFVSYARYLGKILWPFDLAVPYPHPGKWPGSSVLLAMLLVFAASAVAWVTRRTQPYVFVGWFWFAGTLVPVIGLVQVGLQSMADRYTYFPSIGLFLALGWLVAEWVRENTKLRRATVVTATVLIVALAVRTSDQLQHWRNTETLFTHSIRCTRANTDAMSALGNYMLKCGRIDDALEWYKRAWTAMPGLGEFRPDAAVMFLEPNPTNVAMLNFKKALKTNAAMADACAQVLNNIGFVMARKGRADDAILWYRAALELKPKYGYALHNLAVELAVQGKHSEAIEFYTAAVSAMPHEPKIHLGLAQSLKAVGQPARAIPHFVAALSAFPQDASVHEQLGVCFAETGAVAEAIKHYQKALELNPRLFKTRNNLGAAFLSIGQYDEAIQQLRAAIQLSPNYAAAHENLGIALAAMGQLDDAVVHLRRAIELEPDVANTHFNLANVFVQQKKLHAAVVEYRQTLRLDPKHVAALCNLGSVLIELGERAEAARYIRKALELAPECTPAQQLLRSLEQRSQ